MINQKESEQIKNKFLNKLHDYIKKDEKERNIILGLMFASFVIALICTIASSVMIYISYQKNLKVNNVTNNISQSINIVEGEITNE